MAIRQILTNTHINLLLHTQGGEKMQQTFNSLEMVTKIRDAIREEANKLNLPRKEGFIKISFVPSTKEADDTLGGLSEFPEGKGPFDFSIYEFTYALDAAVGFSFEEKGGYDSFYVKKREQIVGDSESADRVFSRKEFIEVVIRVAGADGKNKILAEKAREVVSEFFENNKNFFVE